MQNSHPLPSASNQKKHCTCSPTTHPGSFRCSLHRNTTNRSRGQSYHSSHQLNMRRSAMTNSLVRIGTVEGELVKRALAALIRPSSHQLRRRCDFQPKPSRLSVMSKAED
uniref:Putative ovule protein n=1 Tax=Solanum chacoense TaxID=4108 RepID=A0A0V0GTT3_SOLCH